MEPVRLGREIGMKKVYEHKHQDCHRTHVMLYPAVFCQEETAGGDEDQLGHEEGVR